MWIWIGDCDLLSHGHFQISLKLLFSCICCKPCPSWCLSACVCVCVAGVLLHYSTDMPHCWWHRKTGRWPSRDDVIGSKSEHLQCFFLADSFFLVFLHLCIFVPSCFPFDLHCFIIWYTATVHSLCATIMFLRCWTIVLFNRYCSGYLIMLENKMKMGLPDACAYGLTLEGAREITKDLLYMHSRHTMFSDLQAIHPETLIMQLHG